MLDFGPREDEQLCDAIRSRDMLATKRATEELQAKHPSAGLSYAAKIAIDERNIEALEYLLDRSEVNQDVAYAAAASEDRRVVRIMLDHGWDVNRSLGGGSIPSMLRYLPAHISMSRLLTVSSLAVCNHNFLDWLLASGADPNAISDLNETALSLAILEGTMNAVNRLFGLRMMDTSRGDLLHCAVRREESEDTVELIDKLVLEKGARVDAYEFDNDTAYQMRYGYRLSTALHIACRTENTAAVKALLRHGARVDQLMKQCDELIQPTPLELTSDKPALRAVLLASIGR